MSDYEKGIISNIEYFYKLLALIKKTNRKYISNYYLNEAILKRAISLGKVTYEYKTDGYMNLWLQKKHFNRLYYFIADQSSYEVSGENDECIVCDAFCKESNISTVCYTLSGTGMKQYVTYRKWVCRTPLLLELQRNDKLQLVVDDDGRVFIDALYLYFDELSDLLPDEDEIDEFVQNRHFIGVHKVSDGMLVAGMVYKKQGNVIEEEFVFVTLDYQGKGISKLLHNILYQKYIDEKIKYIAWIRTDNEKSIDLHKAYYYEEQDQFKVTFLKESDSQNIFSGRFSINGRKNNRVIERNR